MKYKTFPGIVLTSICGKHYLVSVKNTICINDTVVFYWKELENGADEETLSNLAAKYFEIDNFEVLQKDIENMLNLLLEIHMIKRLEE